MSEEINKKWLHVSIEKGGEEVLNEEYYKSYKTPFGISEIAVEELECIIRIAVESALMKTCKNNKRHLEIKIIY